MGARMAETLAGFRLAGLLLTGGLVALVLLVGPTAFVSPAIWNGPEEVALPLIHEHVLLWRVANLGFALATVLTAAGLFLAPDVVGARGAQLAWVSAALFILAAVPWLLILGIRLAITPGVADGFVATGTIEPAFAPLSRLYGALFPSFILLASAAIVALGGAVLTGGTLPAPLGWGCVIAGIAVGASYVVIGDTLPAVVYVPTAAVGIAILLARG